MENLGDDSKTNPQVSVFSSTSHQSGGTTRRQFIANAYGSVS